MLASKKKEKQPWVGVIEEPQEEEEQSETESKPISIVWPSSAPAEPVVEKKYYTPVEPVVEKKQQIEVEEKKTAED